MNNAQYICKAVSEGEEFNIIKQVSDYYKINFYELCNITLDLYNYNVGTGLDKKGAKIMSLQTLCDYAYNVSNKKNG